MKLISTDEIQVAAFEIKAKEDITRLSSDGIEVFIECVKHCIEAEKEFEVTMAFSGSYLHDSDIDRIEQMIDAYDATIDIATETLLEVVTTKGKLITIHLKGSKKPIETNEEDDQYEAEEEDELGEIDFDRFAIHGSEYPQYDNFSDQGLSQEVFGLLGPTKSRK